MSVFNQIARYARAGQRILLRYLFTVVYIICRFFPLKSNVVLFESENDFSDNSRALYEYLKLQNRGYRLVWLCHSKELLIELKGRISNTDFIYHNYHFENFKSAWYIATSKYIFFTHGISLKTRRRNKQRIINLWHGVAIKGIKNLQKKETPIYDNLICLSEANRINQSTFLGCPIDIVIPLGYPRNDLLLNSVAEGKDNPLIGPYEYSRIIMWLPTFRESINSRLSEKDVSTATGLPLLDTESKVKDFDDFLNSRKIKLIIKIHHLQSEKPIFKKKFKNIDFVADTDLFKRDLQLYYILGKTDALITDYSSVSIDYLLTDKPMGFILDDYEEYQKSRGKFLFDNTLDILAGRHIYSVDDLKLFCECPDSAADSEQREKVRNQMFKNPDNNSCQRICEFLQI